MGVLDFDMIRIILSIFKNSNFYDNFSVFFNKKLPFQKLYLWKFVKQQFDFKFLSGCHQNVYDFMGFGCGVLACGLVVFKMYY